MVFKSMRLNEITRETRIGRRRRPGTTCRGQEDEEALAKTREQKSRILFPNKTVGSSVYGAALLVLHGSYTLQALDSLCSYPVEEPQTLIRFCRCKIIVHTLISGMRQSSMEKCPLMKNMPLLLYFRELITERSSVTVEDLGRTFIVPASVTVHQRFQTG